MSHVPYVFKRAKGACRDVNELEYLACIHQTCAKTRVDASIVADDIKMLLMSRHGLEVTKRDIEEYILVDLVGRPDKFPDSVMDLRQMMALLLIPQLVKASMEDDEEQTEFLKGGSERSAPPHIEASVFETVLRNIIEDCEIDTGEEEYPVITTGVLKKIFSTYGENNLEDKLLEKMVEMVQDIPSAQPAILDPKAFERVLTSDVRIYDIEWEERLSTHFEDVQTAESVRTRRSALNSKSSKGKSKTKSVEEGLKRVFTFPMIDMDADTFESQAFHVILVLSIVCFYVGYFHLWLPSTVFHCTASAFGCVMLNFLVNWLAILAQLTISGTVIVLLASLSNHSYHQKNWATFLKLVGTTAAIPCMAVLTSVDFEFFVYKNESDAVKWAQYATIITAFILVTIQCGQLLSMLLPEIDMRKLKPQFVAAFFFSSGFHERDTKKAATFKVENIIRNALSLHEKEGIVGFDEDRDGLVNQTPGDLAVNRFLDLLMEKEVVGGFFWVWKQLFTSRLASEEGIFFGARFIGSNLAQWLVLVAFISVVLIALSAVSQEPAEYDEELWNRAVYFNASGSYLYNASTVTESFVDDNDLTFAYIFEDRDSTYSSDPRTGVIRIFLEAIESFPGIVAFVFEETPGEKVIDFAVSKIKSMTGINLETMFEQPSRFANAFDGDFFQFVYSEVESRAETTEVAAGVLVGGIFGALAIAIIALNYLPAYVLNVLQFRSGALGSLHDSRFLFLNRFNPFFTSLLIGGSFWGTAFSGIATGLLFGTPVFLFLWNETRYIMIRLLAISIVLTITWLLRFLAVALIYSSVSNTFVRNKPAASNIAMLVFETWNMGNALGYVLMRAVRVLVIAVFYLGRLDKWVLADGIGELLVFHPDVYPRAFNRDLLVHEAHRHPYAERLAVIYMLKLRFKNQFGNRAGGCWRLIFVSALMPWMIRYRVNRLPEGVKREIKVSAEDFFDDTDRVEHGLDSAGNDYESTLLASKNAPPRRWGQSMRATLSAGKSVRLQPFRRTLLREATIEEDASSDEDLFRDEAVKLESSSVKGSSFRAASSGAPMEALSPEPDTSTVARHHENKANVLDLGESVEGAPSNLARRSSDGSQSLQSKQAPPREVDDDAMPKSRKKKKKKSKKKSK